MNSADVAGLLEWAASERPDILRPTVKALEFSRAAASVAELVERWGFGPENRAADLDAQAPDLERRAVGRRASARRDAAAFL